METLVPEAVKNRETLADVKKRARLVEPHAHDTPTEAVATSDGEEEDAEGDVAM